jgi:hypothetical protein
MILYSASKNEAPFQDYLPVMSMLALEIGEELLSTKKLNYPLAS